MHTRLGGRRLRVRRCDRIGPGGRLWRRDTREAVSCEKIKLSLEVKRNIKQKQKSQWTDPWFAVDTKLFCLPCLSRVHKQRWSRYGRVGLRLAVLTLILNITTPLWDAWEETQKLYCPHPPSVPLFVMWMGSPRRGPVIGGEQHLSREPVTTGDPDWPLRTWPCRVRPTWIELLCARAYICMRRRVAAPTVAVQSKHKRQRKVSAFLSVCDDALQKSARVCRLSCGKCSIFWLSWDFVFA